MLFLLCNKHALASNENEVPVSSLPPSRGRRTHLVPTHVRASETLVTLAGVSLSVRQFFLLVVGAALSYQTWLLFGVLAFLPAGQVLRWILTLLPCGAALACAFVSLADRTLDLWCVVALRYALRPHRFVWRSLRFVEPGLAGLSQAKEVADDERFS